MSADVSDAGAACATRHTHEPRRSSHRHRSHAAVTQSQDPERHSIWDTARLFPGHGQGSGSGLSLRRWRKLVTFHLSSKGRSFLAKLIVVYKPYYRYSVLAE